jgi:hypothetical protein
MDTGEGGEPAGEAIERPAAGGGPARTSPVGSGGNAVDRLLLGLDEAIQQNTAGARDDGPPPPAAQDIEGALDQVFRQGLPDLVPPALVQSIGRSHLPSGTSPPGPARQAGPTPEIVGETRTCQTAATLPAQVLASMFFLSSLWRSRPGAEDDEESLDAGVFRQLAESNIRGGRNFLG